MVNLKIETLTIPGSVTEIGDYSLSLSKLKKLVIEPSGDEDNPTAISIGIFEETVNYTKYKRPITQRLKSLESLELYRDLSCNKSGLFQELPLQSVIIGGDAAVKSEMFYECVNLHSLEFTDEQHLVISVVVLGVRLFIIVLWKEKLHFLLRYKALEIVVSQVIIFQRFILKTP